MVQKGPIKSMLEAPTKKKEKIEDLGLDDPYKVILFNDEIHSFDEVIRQIIKAIGCSFSRAQKITMEVHSKGKALVFAGNLADCLRVSSVLQEIALHTQIET